MNDNSLNSNCRCADTLQIKNNQGELIFVYSKQSIQLHIKVFDIVYRYDLGVGKEMNISQLEKENKWTPREAGYLLRYLNMEDRTITGK